MPDPKKPDAGTSAPTEAKAETKPETKADSASAGTKPKPGEATDPAVHQLIAQRQDHQMVLNSLEPNEVEVRHRRERIAEIDKQLRQMGYDVQ